MTLPVVEVVWGDAHIDTSDISIAKAQKIGAIKRRTVGYLVAENEEGIVMSTDTFDDDEKNVSAPMFVPWGMVLEYWIYR